MSPRKPAASPPRKGPLTADMLPIPNTASYDRAAVYEVGERDGWPKHEIDWEALQTELYDLLARYGGVDCEGATRLRARITDLEVHYHSKFSNVTKPKTLREAVSSIRSAQINIAIATGQLKWVVEDMEYDHLPEGGE